MFHSALRTTVCVLRPRCGVRLVHSGRLRPTRAVERAVPKARPESLAVQVTPEWSLTDDALQIAVTGLERQEPVTLHASVRENDMTFAAIGHYVTDSSGSLDTTQDASEGGGYVGVEPQGLIWAMEQAPGQRSGLRLIKKDVTEPFKIALGVHRGHVGLDELHGEETLAPLVSGSFERSYMARAVKRIPVSHGRVRGKLFLPEGQGPFPGVIDMFGSVGGIVETRSALLASRGIAALALPYFNYQDLPKTFQELHLEYFEEAIEFMLSQPEVRKKGVGVIGTSKGCDIALAMSEFIPGVRAVVAINGVCYSLDAKLKYRGEIVERAEYGDKTKVTFHHGGNVVAIDKAIPWEVKDENMYHIENSDASFLFITSLADGCVAPEASSVAANRLRKYGKTNFEHLQLPGAGHLLEPPYNPHVSFTYQRLVSLGGVLMQWGGEKQAHAHAQVKAWGKVLDFFKEKLV